MRQLVHSTSGNTNLAPFHLWWIGTLVKQKRLLYFVRDCRCTGRGISSYWHDDQGRAAKRWCMEVRYLQYSVGDRPWNFFPSLNLIAFLSILLAIFTEQ